ncbi:Ig-like domain repeat protein [Edaphobacter aggregans]|uniref:Ig-like domain repeat protein n=1 Tax=Edaphobacter aggregans TaxID=570835 RepID=UPI0014704101|nr:Ig-like domain repeat protein [Edaphobacter aggregans]
MKKTKRLLLTALVTLLKISTLLAQNTIHVPGDATTIQGGIDLAKNGETVFVAPGVYNENINFKGKAITVTSGASSFASASATIINAAGDGPVVAFETGEASSSVLNGFTIQGGHINPDDCSRGGGIYVNAASPTLSNNAVINNANYGIYVEGLSSPTIESNNIRGNFYSNVGVTTCGGRFTGVFGLGRGVSLVNADSPQIVENMIENNDITREQIAGESPRIGAGIYINSARKVVLKNNTIRNNIAQGEPGIYVLPQYEVAQKLVMVQNLIYGNRPPDYAQTEYIGDQLQIGGGITPRPILIETNNIIYGGQSLLGNYGPSIIENNIFANPAPAPDLLSFNGGLMCLDREASSSPLTIQNNDSYIAGGAPHFPCNMGSGNIYTDPKFRDPANGDFHAQDTSPTVATGDINAPEIPNADLDNKARTVCNTIDMGVYELRPHPRVTISSSANPTPGGSIIIFTAQVTGNCNVPTGTITFYDGSTAIGAAALNSSATAALTTSLLVVGQHNITAQYSGDFNFESNTSDVLIQTITGDPTTTSLNVSPNPATALSPITLSSQVASPYGTPTGSVTFTAGGTIIATATLSASGQASTTTTTLGAGTYQIVANYTADTRFQPSSSSAVQETVVGADSITILSATPNPSALTQVVAFTAIVRAAHGTAIPTGQVVFKDGANAIGSVALNASGIAALASSSLGLGTHTVTAHYDGSNNFNPSSGVISQSVALIGTSLTLTATPNPANTGQTVTLTAAARSAVAGMTPVGTVSFYDGATILGTADLGSNGTAALSTSSLGVGSHTLQAVLSSTAYFAGSTSPGVNEVIQSYDFSLTLSKTSLNMPSGDYSNISVTVTPIGGFKGSVYLSCEGLPDYALCVFPDGSSVSLADGAKTVIISVNASNVYGYGDRVGQFIAPSNERGSRAIRTVLLVPAFSLLGFIAKRRRYARMLGLIGVAIAFAVGAFLVTGCSGKQPGKTAPGNYALSVLGTSTDGGNLKHSIPLQLTVTQ